jgi:hypothetical protein
MELSYHPPLFEHKPFCFSEPAQKEPEFRSALRKLLTDPERAKSFSASFKALYRV